MTWLLYPDEQSALAAIAEIDKALGFPTPDGRTLTWAVPRRIEVGEHKGKWVFVKPALPVDGEEVEYEAAWWPAADEDI